ncbi:MAG: hypothetical protein LKG40_07545 [Lachnospiraceae bacterium]|jgi:hypothetical protein|nr:hypothetical protein [Lachnospiraceae bacterium]MCI1328793.1 hypothetical protein [Lachnospiraceae bacterium]
MFWNVFSHIWNYLVRFFGSAAMIFTVISAVLVLGEAVLYRLGRRPDAERKAGDAR